MIDLGPRVIRYAARALIVDTNDAVLLITTRDATNPAFIPSWELPGGGALPHEVAEETVIREVREETGLVVSKAQVSPPLWQRSVYYSYRGEKRLQYEAICVVRLDVAAPDIDPANREPFEVEDHLAHRWWSKNDMHQSQERFYPRNLPRVFEALLKGETVYEPVEFWD